MSELARQQTAVTATVDEADEFTDWLYVKQLERAAVSIVADGSWSGTITLQRSFDRGATPLDVEQFSTSEQGTYRADAGCMIRIGVKTGDYTDGSADVRLQVGG